MCLNRDVTLISLDVVTLFTNIPKELIMNNIEKRWRYIEKKNLIPKNKFLYILIALNLILNSTYFTFD